MGGGQIHLFYELAGFPLLVAVGVVVVFFRPLFIISSCGICAEQMEARGEAVELGDAPGRGKSALIAVLILAVSSLTAGFYLTSWIESSQATRISPI